MEVTEISRRDLATTHRLVRLVMEDELPYSRTSGIRNTKQASRNNRPPTNSTMSPERQLAAIKNMAEKMNRTHPVNAQRFSLNAQTPRTPAKICRPLLVIKILRP
jgi:hypothetical protein